MTARKVNQKVLKAMVTIVALIVPFVASGVTALMTVHGASQLKFLWLVSSFGVLALVVTAVMNRGVLSLLTVVDGRQTMSGLGALLWLSVNTMYAGRILIDIAQRSPVHTIDLLMEASQIIRMTRRALGRRAVKSGRKQPKALHIDEAGNASLKEDSRVH